MSKQVVDGVTELLKTAEPAIQCVYFFGSVAKSTTKPNSDIDVAVLCQGLDAKDKCGYRELSSHKMAGT